MMLSCLLLLSVLSVISVNTEINVVGSKDTLAVRVGHNILAKMGKEGIELEKIRDSDENKLLENSSKNDVGDVYNKEDQERKYEGGEDNEQRFKQGWDNFIKKSFAGPSL